MSRVVRFIMDYGLVAAILMWAATVAMMAYHLNDSPWRWAFILLSLVGLATVGVIFRIRKYVNNMAKKQGQDVSR